MFRYYYDIFWSFFQAFMTEDTKKEASLKKSRRFATFLLLLMVLIFFAAGFFEKNLSWLGYFRAFAEAAIVGALADWFAVTALFRHPLGLRLPHTAIIPTNKDRIGESLGKFVEKNFLTPEAISEKLESADIAGKTADWLSHPRNTDLVANEIADFLPRFLDALNDDDVSRFIRRNVAAAVRSLNLAPLAGDFLALLTSRNKHQELFDRALVLLSDLFENYKPALQQRITQESGVLFLLVGGDAKLYQKIVTVVSGTLAEISSDPVHTARKKFDAVMEEFIANLKTSPQYRAKMEEIREEVLGNPAAARYLENIWTDIKESILRDLTDPGSVIRARTRDIIRAVYLGTLTDARIRQRLNHWIQQAVINTVSRHRNEISNIIAEKVKKWDTSTMTRKLELEVGKDLQYIRINGTVIGGLIGLLIHVVSRFF
jgi:uncharacterized membrane-anchored protein YjiN (DUF445 family)